MSWLSKKIGFNKIGCLIFKWEVGHEVIGRVLLGDFFNFFQSNERQRDAIFAQLGNAGARFRVHIP